MPTIASKPYSAGDVIFECKPIIHCIENGYKGKNCDNCLKTSDSLKRCTNCWLFYYCDKNCQTIDWKYHKNECKVYKEKSHQLVPNIVLIRIILRLWFCVKCIPNFCEERHQLFDGSDICLNDIKVETKLLMKVTKERNLFEVLCLQFQHLGIDFKRKELLRVYGLVDSFPLSPLNYYTEDPSQVGFESFQDRVGSAIFIQIPDLRHSCLPNAGHTMKGICRLTIHLFPN